MYKVGVGKCGACETCMEVFSSEAISMVDGHAFISVEECISVARAAGCAEEAMVGGG